MNRENGLIEWQQTLLRYEAVTDCGRVRKANEDTFLVIPEERLFCVADGMGGHVDGGVASSMTVDAVAYYLQARRAPGEMTNPIDCDAARDADGLPVIGAIRYANAHLHSIADGRVMGSTIVAACFTDDGLQVAHVGDSRAYLWRPGEAIRTVTRDHSLVYELFANGRISREEMSTHPQRNVITRSIGIKPEVEPDIQEFEVAPGDWILLCSDGLFGKVDDGEITRLLEDGFDISETATALVAAANAAGGEDNITVLLIEILSA